MRRLLQIILLKPVLWAASKFSSSPDKERIYKALSELKDNIFSKPGEKGPLLSVNFQTDKFIIFSDQHKGAKNKADDFQDAEPDYLAALNYYLENDYQFISLGDNEELWENSLAAVKENNTGSFDIEKKFHNKNSFYKIFGNHDLYWANDPFAGIQLKKIYDSEVKIYEGAILESVNKENPLKIFLTHGHQGDKSSDGNWFSKFFVARVWAPLQSYLKINPNTPAYDQELKTLHNRIMYEWSSEEKNLLLITGHTHQPVFTSLTHLERLHKDWQQAIKDNDPILTDKIEGEIKRRQREYKSISIDYLNMRPGYFNSGCCCFSDGDITGIEIAEGNISLIKWSQKNGSPERILLETIELSSLQALLS